MSIQHKITYILVILIVLSSALKWCLYFPFRIQYYEILMILFVCFFFLSNHNAKSFILKKELKTYILFLWGWFFLAVLSGGSIIINPQGADAYSFYLKGLVQLFSHTCFFTFFIFYLGSIDSEKRQKLLYWFLAGVVISSMYGFIQIILINRGIDIDENISRHIGMKLADSEYINFKVYAYGYLYRLNGTASDPNVHAAYTITGLPLFLLIYITNRNIKSLFLFLIVFVSLVMSMSISGLAGFAFSILALLVLRLRHIKVSQLMLVLFLFIILVFLYSSYEESIIYYLRVKFDTQGTIRSHIDIAINSLKIGLKYPFGVGLNNFSIAYENQYSISNYNPHNSWIAYLVQLGFIGLLYQIIFKLFIISRFFNKKKTLVSYAFTASFIGICIAGIGYQVLDMFFAQLYITIGFSLMIMDDHFVDKSKVIN